MKEYRDTVVACGHVNIYIHLRLDCISVVMKAPHRKHKQDSISTTVVHQQWLQHTITHTTSNTTRTVRDLKKLGKELLYCLDVNLPVGDEHGRR